MTDTKPTGGPAFPMNRANFNQEGRATSIDWREGMTLRDYFAAKALAGMGTWMPNGFSNLGTEEAVFARARFAYAQADAMLEARQ